jgi:hypothetical protein
MAFSYQEVRAVEQPDDVEITEKPKARYDVIRKLHWFLHGILLSAILTLFIWRAIKAKPDSSAGAGFQRIYCE